VDIIDGHEGHRGHLPAALIGALTLLVLVFWNRLIPTKLEAIPAVLVAVFLATVVSASLALPVQLVEFASLNSAVKWIDFAALPRLLTSTSVWQSGS